MYNTIYLQYIIYNYPIIRSEIESRVQFSNNFPLNNSKSSINTCDDLQTRFSRHWYTIQDISRKMRFMRRSRLQDERALVRAFFLSPRTIRNGT